MKESFTRGSFYKTEGGMKHLKHALRDKYDTERIPQANFVLEKFVGGELKECKKEEVYQMYEYNKLTKQRENANLYFEEVVSEYDPEKTKEIAEYLQKKCEGRTVYVVQHRDEAHYHTHFIVFEKDTEHKKAMRLQKKDLHELRFEIGKITEQVVKERGAGLTKHIGVSSNPERTKNLVKAEEVRKMKEEEQLKQIEKVLKVYKKIRIYSLNKEKGMRFVIHNGAGTTEFTKLEQIPIRKLNQVDAKPDEDILFEPVPEEEETKIQYLNAVFIDDIPMERLKDLPEGSVVIQTSQYKYQAHIPLPYRETVAEADALQRALVNYYTGDVGAKNVLHLRRLPGFTNKKYKELPVAKVVQVVENGKSWSEITAEIEKLKQQQAMRSKQVLKVLNIKNREYSKEVQETLERIRQFDGFATWSKYYDKNGGDESAADFSYVLHLLRQGVDANTVYLALSEISPNLDIRKRNHVEDYLTRTIENALKQYKDERKEQKKNENVEKER